MSEKMYTKDHEWIEVIENGLVYIGISNYAVTQLGDIVFINPGEEGDTLVLNESFADVESVKAVSDILSPIDGEIVEINEELLDAPEKLNESPEETWIVKASYVELNEELMSSEDYSAYLESI